MGTKAIWQNVEATVTDENEHYFYAQLDGYTYKVDKKELINPLKIGGKVSGFAYENKDHELQITKIVPKINKDTYAWGIVSDKRYDLGVFVNIGLENKDIVVSLDDLPTIKDIWPQKGDKLMIALKKDQKDRVWGTLADLNMFNMISQKPKYDLKNKDLEATIVRNKMVGIFAITDEYNLVFIHRNEFDVEPRLGQRVSGRVIGMNDKGILNVSLKPRNYEVIDDDSFFILRQLERQSDKFLPFNDKSTPEEIKSKFGFSKAQFKRALGRLLKQGKIYQTHDGIYLKE